MEDPTAELDQAISSEAEAMQVRESAAMRAPAGRRASLVSRASDDRYEAILSKAQAMQVSQMAAMQTAWGRQVSYESDDRYASEASLGRAEAGDVHPLAWTRSFAGGLRADVRRRAPYYASDWADGLGARWRLKCIASTSFLLFPCLAPAISFGALFDKDTDGNLGVFEMILATAISGLVYAVFSGQPLCVMAATGPELVYTAVFYQLCESLGLEFMSARVWQGLWCALFTALTAVTDGCAVCRYVTQFTEDVFSGLVGVIFTFEALANIGSEFGRRSLEGAYFTVLLALGSSLWPSIRCAGSSAEA